MSWTIDEKTNKRYVKMFNESTKILEDAKLQFKEVKKFSFDSREGGAHWDGKKQEIVIFRTCEPGAVPHELGHSRHELLQDQGEIKDLLGDAYAEAIRWFVTDLLIQRLWGFKWLNNKWFKEFKDKKKNDEILVWCEYNWKIFLDYQSKKQYLPPK